MPACAHSIDRIPANFGAERPIARHVVVLATIVSWVIQR
jgi:hypothetical protein